MARHNGEPLAGTTGQNTGWLLIEHPGPWAEDAFASRGLDDDAVEVIKGAAATGVRPLLIKRADRRDLTGPRWVFLVGSTRGTPWIRRFEYDSLSDLLTGLDVGSAREPTPPAVGTPVTDPMYLVCTHAKRDACCAMYGRPIATALSAEHPGVWESSHLGGDRFAPNLVALPQGFSFGHLDVAAARRALRQHGSNALALDHYRGRCLDSFPVQTAEVFVRRTFDIHGIDALDPVAERATEDGFTVAFRHRDDHFTVTVARTETTVCATACGAERSSIAIRFRAVDVSTDAARALIG